MTTGIGQVRQLANGLVDGTASPADAARLSAMLRDHPDLRDAYLDYLDTHAVLSWEFREAACANADGRSTPAREVPRWRRFATVVLPWTVAAIATLVAVASYLRPQAREPRPGPSSPMKAAVPRSDANAPPRANGPGGGLRGGGSARE